MTTKNGPTRWAIHKASRTYDGGTYSGPSLDAADVPVGPYATEAEAQEVADKLLTVNLVGWEVVPYRPRARPASPPSLQFGGMKLVRRHGGVDVEVTRGGRFRLQDADLPEIVEWLTKHVQYDEKSQP